MFFPPLSIFLLLQAPGSIIMNNNSIFDIKNTNYFYREEASYSTDEVTLSFTSETAFEIYKTNIINKHATWCFQEEYISKKKYDFEANPLLKQARLLVKTRTYRCDHAGKPRKTKTKGNAQNPTFTIMFTLNNNYTHR